MLEILKILLKKLTSARFIVTILIITTYCFVMLNTLKLVSSGLISVDLFLGLFTGFAAISGSIITFYFTRNRNDTDENGKK